MAKPVTEVYEMLMDMTKEKINVYRKILDCNVKASLNKADMAAEVAWYIETEAEWWLKKIPAWELFMLKRLVKLAPGEKYDAGFQGIPSTLESLKFIHVEVDRRRHTLYSLSEDMHTIIAPCIDNVLSFIKSQHYDKLDQVLFGMLNLYGVLERKSLGAMMIRAAIMIDYENGEQDSMGLNALMYMEDSLLVNSFTLSVDDKDFVFHPCLQDPGKVFVGQRIRPDFDDYKRYTLEQARDAGLGYPFIKHAQDEPFGQAILQAMSKFKISEKKKEILYHELYLQCQEEPDKIMDFVTFIASGKLESMEQAQSLMETCTNFSNNIPRWELRGFSSQEFYEKFEKPKMNPLPSEPFNPMNFVPKNIGRNDSCPCGSGKKYKNCHGKLS